MYAVIEGPRGQKESETEMQFLSKGENRAFEAGIIAFVVGMVLGAVISFVVIIGSNHGDVIELTNGDEAIAICDDGRIEKCDWFIVGDEVEITTGSVSK